MPTASKKVREIEFPEFSFDSEAFSGEAVDKRIDSLAEKTAEAHR